MLYSTPEAFSTDLPVFTEPRRCGDGEKLDEEFDSFRSVQGLVVLAGTLCLCVSVSLW